MSGDTSDSHSWVCQWHLADARDAANHPTMTRTDTHHEDLCGPNVSSVKVEKTCKRQWGCSWRFLSREMSKKKKKWCRWLHIPERKLLPQKMSLYAMGDTQYVAVSVFRN